MLSKTEWSWELQTLSHKMNLLDMLSTSPHYFCSKWIGATNENANFDLRVLRVNQAPHCTFWKKNSTGKQGPKYEYEIWFKVFLRIVKKYEFFIVLFSPEKLALLSILKEVETSPNCKMLKLLTFDNSPLRLKLVVGTLRSEDGDGRKNVAEKVNSRSFNLHRDYSKSLTLSNVGEPS